VDEVHEEACRLEHAIALRWRNRIAQSLGNPKNVHTSSIPDKDGVLVKEKGETSFRIKASDQGL